MQVRIPMISKKNGEPLALEEDVSRELFDSLIEDLVKRTHHPVDVVLGDSGVQKEQLDLVLLVGGSTRVPLVAKDIRDYLGKEPAQLISPDLAVAQGAAIQAAIIEGTLDEDESIIMTDVNPFTLGISTLFRDSFDYMSVIIPRNVTIPVTKKQVYYTSCEGQESAEVIIYQGEHRTASRNHCLGRFIVNDIPYANAGEEAIEVAFSYNQNGILDVSAVIVSTGREASVTINMMDVQAEERMDVENWREAPDAEDYRTIIRRAEKFLSKEKGKLLDVDAARELEELIYQLKKSIIKNNLNEADELEMEIDDLMDEYSRI